MYKDFYHLTEMPFNITPDPRYLYMTDQHREALNHLVYGIRERKGFMSLTGEVGTGKTTLCRKLLEECHNKVETALILNPMLTETQLLRATCSEFGLGEKFRDRLNCMKAINEFVLKVDASGKPAVLIIDEAQDIPDKTLEMTRLLSNLETDSTKLLQIILVGQPELKAKLAKPKFRQLAQRITVRYHLDAMTFEDMLEYVSHRLEVAAGPFAERFLQFDESALKEIYRYSRGTPRLINAVGDKALLAGYVHRTGTIDRDLVRLAIKELKGAA